MIFLDGSNGKESACNVGDLGSILGSGRSPGEENGNPLQYSSLENYMERGAWRAAVRGVSKSQIGLSDLHFHFQIDQILNDMAVKSYFPFHLMTGMANIEDSFRMGLERHEKCTYVFD